MMALAFVIAVRLPFLGDPLESNEAGYLMAARQWHAQGPFLYGDLWVDRPPLLLLFYWAAARLGDDLAVRAMASIAAAVLVVGAGWTGWLLAGRRGARWSAVAAAALAATPALGTQPASGVLLGAPLVMLCVALTLQAVSEAGSRRGVAGWAFAAGVAGSSAMLVKQNLAGGLVFAAVLLVGMGSTRARSWRQVSRVAGPGALGALVPAAMTVLWSLLTAPGPATLWSTLYGFRWRAADVISDQHLEAPAERLGMLLLLAVVSGVVVIGLFFLRAQRERIRRADPLTTAVLSLWAVGLLGIALGASYWVYYLVQLIPGLALAAGVVAARSDRAGAWMRHAVVFSVGSAASAMMMVVAFQTQEARAMAVGAWLQAASRPGDTGVVLYGQANVLERAGLDTPYPYLWSLPLRVLDPRLEQLRATLAGPQAPTWVVAWGALDAWNLDRGGRLSRLLRAHYREAAVVCGRSVFLHEDRPRPRPPLPRRCGEP